MTDKLKEEFLILRDVVLEKYFDNLNDMQKKAVLNVSGPLLILAGAGSGKTTVLINRIANIIKFGNAYNSGIVSENIDENDVELIKDHINNQKDMPDYILEKLAVNPCPAWRILAITFTNKAANELKERLSKMLGENGKKVWASTFHSLCVRVLRKHAEHIGFDKHFTIYDTDDTHKAIKAIQKELNTDEKMLKLKSIACEISMAKEKMISPEEFAKNAEGDYRLEKIAQAYKLYDKELKASNAMDFDDLVYNTVLLFEKNPDVLQLYRNKFNYIMVDEYQDTNFIQYRLIELLTNDRNNLCVVGDDDQSIYKFRGATVENILNFEHTYPDTQVIRLEQNYRSTQSILNVANDIIKNNTSRKPKKLWTENNEGDKVHIHTSCNEQREAMFMADKINDIVSKGGKYADCAVLYRMNTQAFPIEKIFIKSGIPYRKLSGHRIFDSEEIKDIISYLSVLNNPNDNLRLRRIINKPKRSIGDKTIITALEIADGLGISMFEVTGRAEEFAPLEKACKKLMSFYDMIQKLMRKSEDPDISLVDLYLDILEEIEYVESLRNSKDLKRESRIENVMDFTSTIAAYEKEHPDDASLEGFLEEIALIADIDNYNDSVDAVVMMTVHSAKGLEFPNIFLPGFEDGIFPGIQSLFDENEIEEERRLAYVAVTRAKKNLYIINSDSRMVFGRTSYNKLSVFAKEIPSEHIERTREKDWHKAKADLSHKKSMKDARVIAFHTAHDFNRHEQAHSKVTFKVGDNVVHKVFGNGVIIQALPMGNDIMLQVNFDRAGSKKIMANFSKLQLVD